MPSREWPLTRMQAPSGTSPLSITSISSSPFSRYSSDCSIKYSILSAVVPEWDRAGFYASGQRQEWMLRWEWQSCRMSMYRSSCWLAEQGRCGQGGVAVREGGSSMIEGVAEERASSAGVISRLVWVWASVSMTMMLSMRWSSCEQLGSMSPVCGPQWWITMAVTYIQAGSPLSSPSLCQQYYCPHSPCIMSLSLFPLPALPLALLPMRLSMASSPAASPSSPGHMRIERIHSKVRHWSRVRARVGRGRPGSSAFRQWNTYSIRVYYLCICLYCPVTVKQQINSLKTPYYNSIASAPLITHHLHCRCITLLTPAPAPSPAMHQYPTHHLHHHSKLASIEHSPHLSPSQKIHQISLLKANLAQATDSSPTTIWSITNCMTGSSLIIYPILFIKSGIVVSIAVMVGISIMQFMTCRLLVLHNREDEDSYNESVARIGGPRAALVNSVANMVLYYFICVAVFLLMVHNFYEVSSHLLAYVFTWYHPPQSHEIVFSKYSLQWATILIAVIVRPYLFLKDVRSMLKLIKSTVYVIGAFVILITLNTMVNLFRGRIHLGEFKYFTTDFANITGTFALAFLVHPIAAPILKKNKNLDNNPRDLMLGYVCGVIICIYVGVVGSMSCAPVVQNIDIRPVQYSTVFDCFVSGSQGGDRFFFLLSKLVQLSIMFLNFSALPIRLFMTRNQFLTLCHRPRRNPQLFTLFTWFFFLSACLLSLLAVDVSLILSFDGAIVGFFICYGIPIYIHLRCMYHQYTRQSQMRRKSLMESIINQSILGENEHELELEPEAMECNPHDRGDKMRGYGVYGGIMVMGFVIAGVKLANIVG